MAKIVKILGLLTIDLPTAKSIGFARILPNLRRILGRILLKFGKILAKPLLFSLRQINCQQTLFDDLNELLSDPFANLDKLQGVVYRQQPGRKTIAFTHHAKPYFAKIHTGVGWKEIIKNLFQLRWPIVSAEPEWYALLKLNALGIKAPVPVAFGKQGINPARLKSFIVTEALVSTINLEEFLKINSTITFSVKKSLIKAVANIAKILHENGINHRDFYLCHFLLNEHSSKCDRLNPEIYLIDLHRAQRRNKVPFRWKVKDIAGLYFSTMNFNFTRRDYLRFIHYYTGQPLRKALTENRFFWYTVTMKAHKLYQKF